MTSALGLSVIMIAQNEESTIRDSLESVTGLADEIIVVDSGSSDRTVEISKSHTDKVFQQDWLGYGPQKNVALQKAKGPWVLNIDADERVSAELKEEIRALLSAKTAVEGVNGVEIPFRHYFLGKRLRFGGSQFECHLRLFRKEKAEYGGALVHEGINVSPPVIKCKNFIDHFSTKDTQDYLRKCNEYTSLIAQRKFDAGERFHFWHHVRLIYEFIVRYFLKLGILDGHPGFIYALLSSYYVWLKYLKLRDLEESKK